MLSDTSPAAQEAAGSQPVEDEDEVKRREEALRKLAPANGYTADDF